MCLASTEWKEEEEDWVVVVEVVHLGDSLLEEVSGGGE